MDSTGIENTFTIIGIGIVVVLTFLYALILRGAILEWIFLMLVSGFFHLSLRFFYLALRFVRAVERIATALEE
jgi:uncharacterized membrane protein